jgi:hypothetical protein
MLASELTISLVMNVTIQDLIDNSGAAAKACSPVSHTINHTSNSHRSTNLPPVSLLNPNLLPLHSSLHHPTARGSDNPRGPIIPWDKTTA